MMKFYVYQFSTSPTVRTARNAREIFIHYSIIGMCSLLQELARSFSSFVYVSMCVYDCIHPTTLEEKGGRFTTKFLLGFLETPFGAMAFAGSSRLSGSWERLNRLQSKCRAERDSFVESSVHTSSCLLYRV